MKHSAFFYGKKLIALTLMFSTLMLSGCAGGGQKVVIGGNSAPSAETETEEDDINVTDEPDSIYIIRDFNSEEESIILYSLSNKRQYRYNYSLATKFLDKYGESTSWVNFNLGQAVEIGDQLDSGALSFIKKSDQVWEYDDVTNFSIDFDKQIFKIADTRYKLNSATEIFSDADYATLSDISDSDTLRVVGKDKTVLSIAITTGHGYVKLNNTDKFNNSMMQIGNKVFAMVSKDLIVEVPEGTYELTVANDGYGGTKPVEVVRNQITEVDLTEWEGDGPQFGLVTFQVSVEGVSIYLDGALIENNSIQWVKYGAHSITISADGYDTWKKTLYVNSPKAIIALDLTETDNSSNTAGTSNSTTGNSTTQNANGSTNSSSTTNNTTQNSSTSSSSGTSNPEKDYLTTLSDMMSTLMGTD